MTEPIFLQGVCKDYLWGGNRLREEFGKTSGADTVSYTHLTLPTILLV